MKLQLTLACGEYDRTWPLRNGLVPTEGMELEYISLPPAELFRRQARGAEFDVAELSLCTYSIMLSRGDERFVGLPVFPSRAFRHGNVVINTRAGIREPADLVGKRMGCEEYQMTAAVWERAFLEHDYGVRPRDLEWVLGMQDNPSQFERLPLPLPPDIRATRIPDSATLSQMLVAGEIDAMMTARLPRCYLEGAPNVARLFPNPREVEADYYRRTGYFPIMHMVVVKREIYERHPWVAQSLYKAFVRAKELTQRWLLHDGALACMVPWLITDLEATRQVLGEDYWSYGFQANQAVLEATERYAHEQGLTERLVAIEELFAPETLQGVEADAY